MAVLRSKAQNAQRQYLLVGLDDSPAALAPADDLSPLQLLPCDSPAAVRYRLVEVIR
jgi:hypothetical protein